MWSDLDAKDLHRLTGTVLGGMVRLDEGLLKKYEKFVDKLQSRVHEYQKDRGVSTNQRVPVLANGLNHVFMRVKFLPLSQRQMEHSVTLLQRQYLELTAVLDYLTVYKPRMDGMAPPATEVAWTVGVFTSSYVIAQEFFKAGLPFWLVRPVAALSSGTSDDIVEAMIPDSLDVCLYEANPRYPTIFTGSARDQRKYDAMARYSRSLEACPDPFGTARVEPPLDIPLPAGHQVGKPVPSRSRRGEVHTTATKPCKLLPHVSASTMTLANM